MKKKRKELLIRVDANSIIGSGHLMRCLALAQAWKERGGEVSFITACDSPALLQRLKGEGFQIIKVEMAYPDPDDWATTSKILDEYPDSWVVLDGYHFDSDYHNLIKGNGNQLLVIDDIAHLQHYSADIILNQNVNADQLSYQYNPNVRLLLGSEYVLMRKEFWEWSGWKRDFRKNSQNLLITLGGADPDNQTQKVINAVKILDQKSQKICILIGASNPHYPNILETIENDQNIRIIKNTGNMPELMAWADVAVTAGGSTCWETSFMGLPSIILILADNQRRIARGLASLGVSECLGWYEDVSEKEIADALSSLIGNIKKRSQMGIKGRKLIDGKGAFQVVSKMVKV